MRKILYILFLLNLLCSCTDFTDHLLEVQENPKIEIQNSNLKVGISGINELEYQISLIYHAEFITSKIILSRTSREFREIEIDFE